MPEYIAEPILPEEIFQLLLEQRVNALIRERWEEEGEGEIIDWETWVRKVRIDMYNEKRTAKVQEKFGLGP
jgi:hypothetical protein